MRKVIFKIDDLKWMQKFYNIPEKEMNKIFSEEKAFKVIYTLIGDTKPDTYKLTDYEGNKIKLDSLNGYERGIILNDCFAYYNGNKFFNNLSEPHGVIDIQELQI